VEKVYERELQAALELSLIESQSSNCDDDEDFKPQNNKKSSVIKLDKEKLNNTELTCSDKITEVKNVLCTVKVNEENKTNVINKERQIIQSVDYNTKDTGNTIQNLHIIQENTISKTGITELFPSVLLSHSDFFKSNTVKSALANTSIK
jgi:hypothetical protein